ncbi:hypothetical protein EDB86DRAFT_2905838 [Lactarius hatsudake]|nr:hypothetical protein EDB86DRAFT_2905838 [Lactarius hatsudake]
MSRGSPTLGTLVIELAGTSASCLMRTVLSRWWLCFFTAQAVRTATCVYLDSWEEATRASKLHLVLSMAMNEGDWNRRNLRASDRGFHDTSTTLSP